MIHTKKILSVALILALLLGTFTACGSEEEAPPIDENIVTEDVIDISDPNGDMVPLAEAPAVATMLLPVASGTDVKKNQKAEIDASNIADGYVMIRFLAGGTSKLKVLITGPSKATYNYNLTNSGNFEVFPLSDGNGAYSIGIYQNISGTQYSTVYTASLTVALKDQFAPFLRPNQYVNYTANSEVVKLAGTLTAGTKTPLEKVTKVYDYVINNFTYDKQLAATVQSGYLPNLDAVLKKKSGICFDYAAVMSAMLRSQGVPTKLVVGYTGSAYHAWISVYTQDQGWVDGVIYFNGKEWKLMDPTFASSAKSSESIMKYIGDGKNYSAKYLY